MSPSPSVDRKNNNRKKRRYSFNTAFTGGSASPIQDRDGIHAFCQVGRHAIGTSGVEKIRETITQLPAGFSVSPLNGLAGIFMASAASGFLGSKPLALSVRNFASTGTFDRMPSTTQRASS